MEHFCCGVGEHFCEEKRKAKLWLKSVKLFLVVGYVCGYGGYYSSL